MQKYLLLSAAVLAAFSFPGCSSAPERHERSPQEMAPPLPAMTGEETFADGQLVVEASVSRGYRPFGRRGEGGGGARGGKGGRRHGGGGEGGEGGGWGGGGGGGGGGYGGGGRPQTDTEEDAPREEMRPRLHESTMPPIVLQLRATNKGAEPLDITWVECSSPLGNFGILPIKMSLPPGQSAEPERMTSLLGVSGDEIPVTVTLRAHGKQEKKTLVLHPARPDAAPKDQDSAGKS